MIVDKEKLEELQEILKKEYGSTLSEENLLNEALRLSEFTKTILSFNLSKNKNNIN